MFLVDVLDIEIISFEIMFINPETGVEATVSSIDGGGGGQFTEAQAWLCEGLVSTLRLLEKSVPEASQAMLRATVSVENLPLETVVHTQLGEGIVARESLARGEGDSLAGQAAHPHTEHRAARLQVAFHLQGGDCGSI